MLFSFNKDRFQHSHSRERFAKIISHVIVAVPFDPQKCAINASRFSLIYRNQSREEKAEELIAPWICYRLGCQAIE